MTLCNGRGTIYRYALKIYSTTMAVGTGYKMDDRHDYGGSFLRLWVTLRKISVTARFRGVSVYDVSCVTVSA
jgi:hypothetical protein